MKELSGHILLFLTHSAVPLTCTHDLSVSYADGNTQCALHPLNLFPMKFHIEWRVFGWFQHSSVGRKRKQRQNEEEEETKSGTEKKRGEIMPLFLCLLAAVLFPVLSLFFIVIPDHLYATKHRCKDTNTHIRQGRLPPYCFWNLSYALNSSINASFFYQTSLCHKL